MKKYKILLVATIAIVTLAMTTFNVVNFSTKTNNGMSDLMLANAEALASDENSSGKGLPDTQVVTDYIYDDNGRLIKTIVYNESCCRDGLMNCSYKRCGT